jgi:hypothetical protein
LHTDFSGMGCTFIAVLGVFGHTCIGMLARCRSISIAGSDVHSAESEPRYCQSWDVNDNRLVRVVIPMMPNGITGFPAVPRCIQGYPGIHRVTAGNPGGPRGTLATEDIVSSIPWGFPEHTGIHRGSPECPGVPHCTIKAPRAHALPLGGLQSTRLGGRGFLK